MIKNLRFGITIQRGIIWRMWHQFWSTWRLIFLLMVRALIKLRCHQHKLPLSAAFPLLQRVVVLSLDHWKLEYKFLVARRKKIRQQNCLFSHLDNWKLEYKLLVARGNKIRQQSCFFLVCLGSVNLMVQSQVEFNVDSLLFYLLMLISFYFMLYNIFHFKVYIYIYIYIYITSLENLNSN